MYEIVVCTVNSRESNMYKIKTVNYVQVIFMHKDHMYVMLAEDQGLWVSCYVPYVDLYC